MAANFIRSLEVIYFGSWDWITRMTWREYARSSGAASGSFTDYLKFYWPFLKLDTASLYRGGVDLIGSLQEPYANIEKAHFDAVQRFRESAWFMAYLIGHDDRDMYLATYRNVLITVAQVRLAKVALGIEEAKKLADPFAGSSLKVRVEAGKTIAYSIGPDGKDDNGRPMTSKTGGGDIVWVLR